MPNSVRYIDNRAFSSNENLKKVTLSERAFSEPRAFEKSDGSMPTIVLRPDTEEMPAISRPEYLFDKKTGTILSYKCIDKGRPVAGGEDLVIPSEIDGVAVRAIAEGAFWYQDLRSVEILDSVEKIGHYAFAFSGLQSVKFGKSVREIGENAFWGNHLTSVELPDSLTVISSDAFQQNQLQSVKLPSGLTKIEGSVFFSNKLKSVDIPDTVVTVGQSAFAFNEIASLKLSASLKVIERGAFSVNKLNEVHIPNGVQMILGYAFMQNPMPSVKISASVEYLSEEAFYDDVQITRE